MNHASIRSILPTITAYAKTPISEIAERAGSPHGGTTIETLLYGCESESANIERRDHLLGRVEKRLHGFPGMRGVRGGSRAAAGAATARGGSGAPAGVIPFVDR